MSFGVQTLNQYGQEEFNSSAEHTLFLVYEQAIAGNSVGSSGLFFMFPDYTGLQIFADLVSPYQSGDIDGWAVLSCRVSYSSAKVPQVLVFVDNTEAGLPVCDGFLKVHLTGAVI